ncbi:MAG TPA: hypothetical protein VMC79_09565 [Rectinemataceae bacterium]|nr:hypothetical protein [Rectinemataceae bacterium]
MKSLRIALIVGAAALLLASCMTFKATGLAVTAQDAKFTVLGNFSTRVWVNEFLGSPGGAKILNVTADATDPAIAAAIDREIKAKGGTAAVAITIVHRASFVNILLAAITAGIYAPSVVEISGTVVR